MPKRWPARSSRVRAMCLFSKRACWTNEPGRTPMNAASGTIDFKRVRAGPGPLPRPRRSHAAIFALRLWHPGRGPRRARASTLRGQRQRMGLRRDRSRRTLDSRSSQQRGRCGRPAPRLRNSARSALTMLRGLVACADLDPPVAAYYFLNNRSRRHVTNGAQRSSPGFCTSRTPGSNPAALRRTHLGRNQSPSAHGYCGVDDR